MKTEQATIKSDNSKVIATLEARVKELELALQRIADATDGSNPGHAGFYFEARRALERSKG